MSTKRNAPGEALLARLRSEFMAVVSEALGAPLYDPTKRHSEQVRVERPYDLVAGDADFASFSLDGFDPTPEGGFLARYSGAPIGQRKGFEGYSYPERHRVLEMIARVLERRSRRMDDEGNLTAIPEDWDSVLVAKHPDWFRHVPLEHGPGWSDLFQDVVEQIERLPDDEKQGFSFSQIKEKFGGLRAYHVGGAAIEDIVDAAETLSEAICDRCGAPGHPRGGGWIVTRCDEHAPK